MLATSIEPALLSTGHSSIFAAADMFVIGRLTIVGTILFAAEVEAKLLFCSFHFRPRAQKDLEKVVKKRSCNIGCILTELVYSFFAEETIVEDLPGTPESDRSSDAKILEKDFCGDGVAILCNSAAACLLCIVDRNFINTLLLVGRLILTIVRKHCAIQNIQT